MRTKGEGIFSGAEADQMSPSLGLRLLADWDSLESHENVNNNAELMEPLMKDIMQILRADPPWWHIQYSESSSRPSSTAPNEVKTFAPASSILSCGPVISDLTDMYMSPSISSRDASAIEGAWAGFVRDALGKADGFVYAGQGWVMEEMECSQVEGGKAKIFHTAVCWESEEKRNAFEESTVKKEFNEKVQAHVKHVKSSLFKFRPQ